MPFIKAVRRIARQTIDGVYYFIFGVVFNPPLASVAIEINSFCNRKCSCCPNSYNLRPKVFLEKELFCKIIEDLKRLRFRGRLAFHLYNEPLLDGRLEEFITYARRKLPKAYLYLNSNGDALTLNLWQKLRAAGLDHITITQYEGKVSEHIEEISRTLSAGDKKHLHIRIYDFKTACNRAGAVKNVAKPAWPLSRRCLRPAQQLCVNYQGQAVLCCNDYFGEVILGDLRVDHVRKLWQSPKIKGYRRRLFAKDRCLSLCERCDL